MPAAPYKKNPPTYMAAQNTDLNDLSGLWDIGVDLFNGPDNLPMVWINDNYVEIPVGSWLVRVDDPDTTLAVYTDEYFQANFTAVVTP